MDIKKSKKKKPQNKKPLVIGGAIAFAVAAVFSLPQQADVDLSDVIIDSVSKGHFEVSVSAFGVLESQKKELITAQSNAIVKEVLIKPGGVVNAGTPIVRLDNPELMQALEQAKRQLVQEEAMLKQTIVNQKIQRLNHQSDLTELESQLDIAKLRRDSEKQLAATGIVSKLDYETSKLNMLQLERMLKIQQDQILQLNDLHQEEIKIAEQLIGQQQSLVDLAQSRVEALTVTANFTGVVQQMFVEVGQSLNTGAQIAEVGSTQDLVALLQVPQSQASQLAVAQPAEINLQGQQMKGQVTRIEPVVVNNNISVEITFDGALPESARPQLNIQGKINIAAVDNALYIKTPINTQPNSFVTLFAVDEDNQTGTAKRIQLGRQSGKFTEIKSGAGVGERFILSNLASLAQKKQEISLSE